MEEMFKKLMELGTPLETPEEQQKRMAAPCFQETQRKINQWRNENKELFELHEFAIEDYITARNAVLNLGLLKSGLALAAQAIEKELKCYLLVSGCTIKKAKSFNHRILDLINYIAQNYDDNYSRFLPFGEELVKWYNSRYPDSDNKSSGWSRNAVKNLDEFFIFIEDTIPIPDDLIYLKYGGGNMGMEWQSIFVRLFSSTSSQHRNALISENSLLRNRENELWQLFQEHRMKASMPATTLVEDKIHSDKRKVIYNEYGT